MRRFRDEPAARLAAIRRGLHKVTKARGVVFDLDGTLVDSAPDLASALNAALIDAARPAVTLSQVRSMVGDGVEALVVRGFEATGGPPPAAQLRLAVDHCLAYYTAHLSDESRLYTGVEETLHALRNEGYVLGVCTNKPANAARRLLGALHIDRVFGCIAGGDSFPYRKPDPRHLFDTLAHMQVTPEKAVMVGDSENDVTAARGAGLPVILTTFGYSARPVHELSPDAVMSSFDALLDLLHAIRCD